jgi:hypothetical protein
MIVEGRRLGIGIQRPGYGAGAPKVGTNSHENGEAMASVGVRLTAQLGCGA